MPRTESKNFQCHPDDVQNQIDFHQKFHWSLLSSQDVKNTTSGLMRHEGKIYSETKTEHFVKLTFSRDLDTPNLDKIKELEAAYHELPERVYTDMSKVPETRGDFFLVPAVVGAGLGIGFGIASGSLAIGIVTFIIGLALSVSTYVYLHKPSNDAREKELERAVQEGKQETRKLDEKRLQILSEVAKYS